MRDKLARLLNSEGWDTFESCLMVLLLGVITCYVAFDTPAWRWLGMGICAFLIIELLTKKAVNRDA
jgi:hypothetical protein